jgi:hypothetical protein
LNTAAIRVGRLLEIRAISFRSVAEGVALFSLIGAELTKLPSTSQVVTVTDWRYCPLMSEEAAEHALVSMTKNNPRVLRSGAIASRDSPVGVLQFLRLVRESKLETRRLFFDVDPLKTWLNEVLTEPERLRLNAFLQEPVQVERNSRRA